MENPLDDEFSDFFNFLLTCRDSNGSGRPSQTSSSVVRFIKIITTKKHLTLLLSAFSGGVVGIRTAAADRPKPPHP
ncbi:hypothetical protein [Dyadobacter sp. NIV53]|uniref:hypothetical protein n=1 Tax=Dyadobacter sp. NIV53 TaxID=2861765 RepID=UPI001C871A1E|nr:hypothetical protein [Dyadobacter sp. NIV53]